MLAADDLRHQLVAHHEVGCRRVLVYEQGPGAGLERLDARGCLRGGAACIGRRKTPGIRPAGKVVDKKGDVRLVHGAAVLGPELHSGRIADGKLAAVAGDVVVHALLQGLQQRGLAMVAAAHDERHTAPNSHAAHGPAMRQLHAHAKRFGRLKRARTLHGARRHTAFARQHAPVGHEGHQVASAQLLTKGMLVVGKVGHRLGLRQVALVAHKRLIHHARHEVEEHPRQGRGVHRAAVRGEARLEAQLKAALAHDARAALQHLGPRPARPQKTALARASHLVAPTRGGATETPHKEVFERDPAPWHVEEAFGPARLPMRQAARKA